MKKKNILWEPMNDWDKCSSCTNKSWNTGFDRIISFLFFKYCLQAWCICIFLKSLLYNRFMIRAASIINLEKLIIHRGEHHANQYQHHPIWKKKIDTFIDIFLLPKMYSYFVLIASCSGGSWIPSSKSASSKLLVSLRVRVFVLRVSMVSTVSLRSSFLNSASEK